MENKELSGDSRMSDFDVEMAIDDTLADWNRSIILDEYKRQNERTNP